MIEFTLPTMTCGHCVGAVTQALQAVAPQARVHIELATKKVQVEGADDRAALERALCDAGYEPA
jgi:copper chaperone